MLNILVKLEVKDFDALEEFETQAVRIMKEYKGSIVSAFETVRNPDGSGVEIHVLQFPSESLFASYRSDKSFEKLSSLRERAISRTEVSMSLKVKSYA